MGNVTIKVKGIKEARERIKEWVQSEGKEAVRVALREIADKMMDELKTAEDFYGRNRYRNTDGD